MDYGDRITTLAGKAVKTHKVTGASIAIISGNEPLLIRNFGYSDKRNRIPVKEDTIFRIGSITKVFTASSVMQLAEQGKIDIDHPVKDYIPEFSCRSRIPLESPITVRDILCHHSGLPCDNLQNYFSADPYAFHSVINYLQNAWLVCPPKKMFYYSNLGYEVLGVLISRLSGIPYHEYIETLLLKECGMNSSAIILSDEQIKDLSRPYRNGKEQTEGMMKHIPEGGIHSTSSDMGLFMKSILAGGKGIFAESKTLEAMLIPQHQGNNFDMDFVNGLGWFIGKPGLDYAGKVIWHDGGTPNFFSLMVLIPERKLGIIILTNSATGSIMNHKLSTEILQILLKELYGIPTPEIRERNRTHVSQDDLSKSTGRFFTLQGIATVEVSCKRLIARMPSGTFLLHKCNDGWFTLSLLLFKILPLRLKGLSMIRICVLKIDGEKVLAIEQLGIRSLQGKLFRPLNTSEAWKNRTGEYVCVNESNPRLKSFRLISDAVGIKLLVNTDKIGHLNFYLDVINDSEAITTGYGRYTGETIILSENSIILFGLVFQKKTKRKALI